MVELPIDGTWDLVGLYALDVEGRVRCNMTGTLQLRQLPGGVNTIVGTGQKSFDCIIDGQHETWETSADLTNSRLTGTQLSMTMGACGSVAEYDPTRPDVLGGGVAFCQTAFLTTGIVDLAGTWEGHRRDETP